MIELRKLTADWTNPGFDRRKKYDLDAHKVLKAGTKIVVRRMSDRFGDRVSVRVIGIRFAHAEGKLAEQVVAVSEPTVPETWKEWLALNDDMDGVTTNSKVLEILFQENPGLRPMLEAAFAKVQEQYAAEDAA